jgi:ABC-type nitrate/sulfonate/bicarbonate transport system substrate-binding protein
MLGRGGILAVLAVAALSLAACGSGSSPSSAAANKLTTVTVEIPTANGIVYVPYYLGIQDGIYKKYRIDLKLETITPTTAVDLIRSGGLDFMSATGSAQASSIKGFQMPTYVVQSISQIYDLIGGPGITKMSQLKGKVIVGESAVSATNVWEQTVLAHYGIPASSVSVINIPGGNTSRIAYVKAGKAAATAVTPIEALQLEKEGMHLLSIGNFPSVEQAAGGLATSVSFANSHKALMKNIVAATVEATKDVRENSKLAEATLERAPYDTPKSEVKAVWKLLASNYVATGKPPQVAITNLLEALKTQYQLSSAPKESYLFDWQYLPGK